MTRPGQKDKNRVGPTAATKIGRDETGRRNTYSTAAVISRGFVQLISMLFTREEHILHVQYVCFLTEC